MFEDLFEAINNIVDDEPKEQLPVVNENPENWDTGREQAFWKNVPDKDSIWKN
jgi:hypothetical protein